MRYEQELNLLKTMVPRIFAETEKKTKQVSYKQRHEIVTSSDLYIETELIKAIKTSFPNDHIHSEEFNRNTELQDRTWIIDPIDGTSNYVHHLELFVVQVAFYDQGEVSLAYVYVPRLNKTYYAVKGEGAFLNGEPVSVVSEVNKENKLISMVGISHQTTKDKVIFMKLIQLSKEKGYKLRALGSLGLEMAAMSEGAFVCLYTDVTNLWDILPGLLLIREAGGLIVNEKGERYTLKDQHFLAFDNKETQNQILDFIRN